MAKQQIIKLEKGNKARGNTNDAFAKIEENFTEIYDDIDSLKKSAVTGTQVSNIIKLTQEEYDAIDTPDASTMYIIVG